MFWSWAMQNFDVVRYILKLKSSNHICIEVDELAAQLDAIDGDVTVLDLGAHSER